MSILALCGYRNSVTELKITFFEGPQDVDLMVTFTQEGEPAEHVITDVEPEVLDTKSLQVYDEEKKKVVPNGSNRLLRFPGARYVIAQNIVRIDKTLKIEDVLPLWMGIKPKPLEEAVVCRSTSSGIGH